MKKIVLFLIIVFFLFPGKTQSLTWAPTLIVENADATNVAITADATRDKKGLPNYTPASDIYIHTGVYELVVRDFVRAHALKTLRNTLKNIKNPGISSIEVMALNEFERNNTRDYNPDFIISARF